MPTATKRRPPPFTTYTCARRHLTVAAHYDETQQRWVFRLLAHPQWEPERVERETIEAEMDAEAQACLDGFFKEPTLAAWAAAELAAGRGTATPARPLRRTPA